MKQAVIGLGSNLGDSGENLKKAIEALAALPHTKVLRCSSLYRTPPVEVEDEQPDYLNQCVLLETELSPRALLGSCLGIEAAMGRRRVRWHGARCLDLDLLLYEGEEMDTEELHLPHPGILNRAFVLVPLEELCPCKRFFTLSFEKAYNTIDKTDIHMVESFVNQGETRKKC